MKVKMQQRKYDEGKRGASKRIFVEAFSTYTMDGFGLFDALFYQSTPKNVSIFLEKLMKCYIVDTEGVIVRKSSWNG